MKKILGLVLISLSFSLPSFALVRVLANCTTSDGQYSVLVQDNQGNGPIRTSHVSSLVTDASGQIVAHYEAEEYRGIQSASFGRKHYQDTQTKGQQFLLSGPSTNFRNYSLKVTENISGTSQVIADDNLSCAVFGGILLNP